MRLARIHLWLLAIAVAASALVLLNQVLGIFFLRFSNEAIVVSLVVGGYAIVGLCCAAVHDNGRLRRLMRLGMIMGVAGAACWIVMIGMPEFFEVRMFLTTTLALCVLAGAIAVIGLLNLFPLRTTVHRGMRFTAIVGALLLAAFIVGAIWFAPGSANSYATWNSADWQRYVEYEASAYRIGTGIAIFVGLLTAATIVVGVVDLLSARGRQSTLAPRPYWLRCPRCGCEQQAMTGAFQCATCRLRTKVEMV